MLGKFTLLLIVYGGPSVAALLVLIVGAAIARTRAETMAVAAISGALVLVHAGALVGLAGMATALFLRRRGLLSGGTK